MKKYPIFFLFLFIFFISTTVMAASDRAVYKQTDVTIPGMNQVKFLSISGKDIFIDYKLIIAEYIGCTYELFFLENPNTINKMPKEASIPEYLDKDNILAVLSLYEQIDVSKIRELTKTDIAKDEYTAAVQTAICLIVAENSQQYRIVESSINNSDVIIAAKLLIDEAEKYLKRKPVDSTVFDYMWSGVTLKVNSSLAKGNIEGLFNFYGPYYVEANDLSINILPKSKTENYAIVNSIGEEVVDSVRVNEPFYVRFGKNLISDININFCAETVEPVLKSYGNFIFVHKEKKEVSTNLNIGNKNGTGNILFIKYDPITNTAISGVVAEIRDSTGAIITTITTNEKGEALSPDLKAGSYAISELTSVQGYTVDDRLYEVTINGNGKTVKVTSEAKLEEALVTFICEDSSTSSPVEGSIFEVINNKNEVVTKIGFKATGRCANIKLPKGNYVLKEISTNPAYELITGYISFNAVAGEYHQVKINKKQAFNHTKFVVIDSNGNPISNTMIELYREEGISIAEMETNNLGNLEISLPVGKYYVRNKATNTSASGKMQYFQVLPSSDEIVVELGINNYDNCVIGNIYDTSHNPITGVSIVAVDDLGEEYSVASSNFEGKYKLDNLPDKAVIFIQVYKAPYGITGEGDDKRVITLDKENHKDLILKSLEEYNSELPEDKKVSQYDFYKLTSSFAVNENNVFDNFNIVEAVDEVDSEINKETETASEAETIDLENRENKSYFLFYFSIFTVIVIVIISTCFKLSKSKSTE